jgi:hypothetical protein
MFKFYLESEDKFGIRFEIKFEFKVERKKREEKKKKIKKRDSPCATWAASSLAAHPPRFRTAHFLSLCIMCWPISPRR